MKIVEVSPRLTSTKNSSKMRCITGQLQKKMSNLNLINSSTMFLSLVLYLVPWMYTYGVDFLWKVTTIKPISLSPIRTVANEVVTWRSEGVNIYGEEQDTSRVTDIVADHYAVMVPSALIKLQLLHLWEEMKSVTVTNWVAVSLPKKQNELLWTKA